MRKDRVALIVKLEALKYLVPAYKAGNERGDVPGGVFAVCAELKARSAELADAGLLPAFEELARGLPGSPGTPVAAAH